MATQYIATAPGYYSGEKIEVDQVFEGPSGLTADWFEETGENLIYVPVAPISDVDLTVNQRELINLGVTFRNKVVIFGDSNIERNTGESATVYEGRNGGFFTVANHIRNSQFVLLNNAGVGGDTTADMMARVQSDVFDYNPDISIILGGTNDLVNGVPYSTIVANLASIYKQHTDIGVQPIACLIPASDQFGDEDEWNRANLGIAEYARANSIILVDLASAMVDVTNTTYPYHGTGYMPDGTHFGALGAVIAGDLLADALPETTFQNPVPATNSDVTNLYQNTLLLGGTEPNLFGSNNGGVPNVDVTQTKSLINKGGYNEYQVEQTNVGSNIGGLLIYTSTSTGIVAGKLVSGGMRVRITDGMGMTVFEPRMIFRGASNEKLFEQKLLYGAISPAMDNYNQEGDILFPDHEIPVGCTYIEFQLHVVGVTYQMGMSKPRIMDLS